MNNLSLDYWMWRDLVLSKFSYAIFSAIGNGTYYAHTNNRSDGHTLSKYSSHFKKGMWLNA